MTNSLHNHIQIYHNREIFPHTLSIHPISSYSLSSPAITPAYIHHSNVLAALINHHNGDVRNPSPHYDTILTLCLLIVLTLEDTVKCVLFAVTSRGLCIALLCPESHPSSTD